MFATSALLLFSCVTLTVTAQNTSYRPIEVYEGAGFFSSGDHYDPATAKWDFFTDADPTHGTVQFVGFGEANNASLIGTISGGPADGAAYLGVDFTNQTSAGRRSTRLESKRTYGYHLMIADIYHQPAVCGAWPALWMLGPNPWPLNGEIDLIEAVNDSPNNRMSLHTKDSVIIANHTQYMKGTLVEDQCGIDAGGVGCSVVDTPDAASTGSKFNGQSGGTYAFEFSTTGIQIWFFPRGSAVPADISSGMPKPSALWGKPNGMFMGDVDWPNKFKDLKVIVETTFCGDWAGKVWASSPCASLAPTCEAYVAQNGQAYKDAYWAVKSIKMYEQM